MGLTTYLELLRIPAVRRILVLGTIIRIPMWAAAVVLTLHVVGHLGRSYAAAGVAEMVFAGALALGGPWRGRRLDRIGLRATLAPSLVVLTVCWCVAPWVGYLPLLALVLVAGLFVVPQFSIVRQVLIDAAPDERRTAVLAVDSVVVEISFMIGPVLGVIAATTLPTPVALMLCELLSVAGACWLWWADPPLRRPTPPGETATATERHPVRSWLSPAVVGILVVSTSATIVLTGEDLGTVAALRSMDHTTSIGWVLGLWGLSSAIGGILYGVAARHPPSSMLIALLAVSTLLVPLAQDRWQFAVLLFLTGFFCAPTITATLDDLSRAVPLSVRGEALGWHGSALTLGSAAGAPLVGLAIDAGGWRSGFVLTGGVGLVISVVTYAVTARLRREPVPASGSDVAADDVRT